MVPFQESTSWYDFSYLGFYTGRLLKTMERRDPAKEKKVVGKLPRQMIQFLMYPIITSLNSLQNNPIKSS